MCGIYGFDFLPNANISRARKATLITALAFANEDRGAQSWGAFLPDSGKLIKRTGSILSPKDGLNVGDFVTAPRAIVHTRYATRGALTAANAHPFDLGDGWVGQHNGVVGNYGDLDKRYGEEPVDSIHLLKAIAGTKPIPFHEINVYGSVQLVPPARDRILLGRFNGGELCIVEIPRVGLVFTSDDEHMAKALRLAGLDDRAEYHDVKVSTLYAAVNGKLFVEDKAGLVFGSYSRMTYGTWQSGGNAVSSTPSHTVPRTSTVYGGYDRDGADWWQGEIRGRMGLTTSEVSPLPDDEDDEELLTLAPANPEDWPEPLVDAWDLYGELSDLELKELDSDDCDTVVQTIQRHLRALAKLEVTMAVDLFSEIEDIRELLTMTRIEIQSHSEQLQWHEALVTGAFAPTSERA